MEITLSFYSFSNTIRGYSEAQPPPLGLRHREDVISGRFAPVDHSTMYRSTVMLAPALDKAFAKRHQKITNS
jgi:transposase-like protein